MSELRPHRIQPRAAASAAFLLLALVAQGLHAQPSTGVVVAGHVATTRTFDLGALQALPAVTQTDSFLAAGVPQTHVYTGTPLWGVLNSAGLVVDPAVRNDVLNQYVVATGTDGYRSVFSLGELSPSFGNRPDLVAYAETVGGVSQPLAADGFARVTAPGDVRGGRYVSNLASLTVHESGATQPATGGGTSTSFRVSGDVLRPASFDAAALAALPARSVSVGSDVFTGVSFWDLLSTTVGLRTDDSVRNDVLGMFVVATGSDGYRSVFSLGELSPLFGNQPDLIATGVGGNGLGADGFARIVVPNDVRRGRYVSDLVSLEVFHVPAVPEPETVVLMLAGLGFMVPAWRRRGARGRDRLTA